MTKFKENIRVKKGGSDNLNSMKIPVIIFEMGLSLTECGFYIALKSLAKKNSIIDLSIDSLSEVLNCSGNTIRNMKKKLSVPSDVLGGLSLIKITNRFSGDGGCLPDIIEMVDLNSISKEV